MLGALTHTKLTWAPLLIVPQLLVVTLVSSLCLWYCGHSLYRGMQHASTKNESIVYDLLATLENVTRCVHCIV